MLFPLDAPAIAAGIGLPLEDWPGNCQGVVEAILRKMPIRGMRLVRGHYHGLTHRASIFPAGVAQHSWIELADGRILDPTLWVFTAPGRPFIHLGANMGHDEAGRWLHIRTGASLRGHLLLSGDATTPAAALAAALTRAEPARRAALLDRAGLAPDARPDRRTGEQIHDLLRAPVEHLADPTGLYAAARDAGLKAFIPIDCWIRVMEPGRVRPAPDADPLFDPPPFVPLTEAQVLFRLFSQFLSIEERPQIETELEELGISLDDLHGALNRMDALLRVEPDLPFLYRDARDILCSVAAELLGKGFGEQLRVERHARALGLDRNALHRALQGFARPAGLDLPWLHGQEALLAERDLAA